MESDLDVMFCDSTSVCQFFIPGLVDDYILMVKDDTTRPGYVKLQAVKHGKPLTSDDWDMIRERDKFQFKVDHTGRIVRSNESVAGESFTIKREKHGPAETFKYSYLIETDNVHACRCASWPTFAMEWIYRERKYNWPSSEIIEKFQDLTCFLVRKGHPCSDEIELEWRVSFSLQERDLIHSFNETQYKCLVLLKLINKDIIKKEIGESISSYHCKTCMFYAIEDTPESMWKQSNLISCLMHCLKLLMHYIDSWNCPNYFIPDENMFDRLDKNSTQTRLQNVISGLIEKGPSFLYLIETDNIGQFLSNVHVKSKLMEVKELSNNVVASRALSIHVASISEVFAVKKKLLQQSIPNLSGQESNDSILREHQALLNMLLNTNEITEHTEEQTKDAIEMVIPFIQTSLACHLVSYAMQEVNQTLRNCLVVLAAQYFTKGIMSDVSSSRLKFATVLFNLGQYDACSNELDILEELFKTKPSIIHMCRCRELRPTYSETLKDLLKTNEIETRKILRSFFSTCIMFLPSESHLIPEALHFEMFRSTGTRPNSNFEEADHWYKWVAVDGIIYLNFMRYLLAIKQKKGKRSRCLSITGIMQCLKLSLNHRETAFNLLAWACIRETFYIQAMRSLIASWRELERYDLYYHTGIKKEYQSHHNAAKWHFLIFLYNLWMNGLNFDKSGDCVFCFGCLKSHLNRESVKTCSKCHVARYCSKQCQASDWSNHKAACKMKSKIAT